MESKSLSCQQEYCNLDNLRGVKFLELQVQHAPDQEMGLLTLPSSGIPLPS